MGLIPIHVYLRDDVPWVPYADLFGEIGFVSDSSQSGLNSLVGELLGLTVEEQRAREERITSLIESHFSPAGAMHQIGLLMKGEANDLRCQALPSIPNH